jgi:hypothetical protein
MIIFFYAPYIPVDTLGAALGRARITDQALQGIAAVLVSYRP